MQVLPEAQVQRIHHTNGTARAAAGSDYNACGPCEAAGTWQDSSASCYIQLQAFAARQVQARQSRLLAPWSPHDLGLCSGPEWLRGENANFTSQLFSQCKLFRGGSGGSSVSAQALPWCPVPPYFLWSPE